MNRTVTDMLINPVSHWKFKKGAQQTDLVHYAFIQKVKLILNNTHGKLF